MDASSEVSAKTTDGGKRDEALRLACLDAADIFEFEPDTFSKYAYARLDGKAVEVSLRQIVTEGNSFCAVGAISYLAECPRYAAANFLLPSVADLCRTFDASPEDVNNIQGVTGAIRLLRHAAIRTEVVSSKAE